MTDNFPDWNILRDRLQHGAEHDIVARERLMPRDAEGRAARPAAPPPGIVARAGAVLALLYPVAGELYIPLTVRTSALRNHSGEVSLPGGSFDPADGALEQTALREAWEELGIIPSTVEIVTTLTPVWISVSNFQITPFIGLVYARPDFVPAPAEVAEVIEVPLRGLLDPQTVHAEAHTVRGEQLHVPYFAIGAHKVWGATALVLAQLVHRLRSVPLLN